jgi:all-trans-8'-apo-beta-carotenal 15,15'-oxygenase
VYSHADWSHAYCSATGEHDASIASAAIEGAIPRELLGGVLYRNGPGLFERGGKPYKHMLDGDGYVCRFEFHDDGSCAFISRFVRTEEFSAEDAANAVAYRGTFGTMRDGGPRRNAFDLRQKNLANTNILAWGGRVYALYEAGRPVELDPATLCAKGETDLDGKVPRGMFVSGAFYYDTTPVPVRPRSRRARRSSRTSSSLPAHLSARAGPSLAGFHPR